MKSTRPTFGRRSQARPALVLSAAFTVLCGALYPAAVTAAAQGLFPGAARGSFVTQGGRVVASDLIGQAFTSPGYFWGRPSATGPYAYNAGASSGSNLGPTNPALTEAVAQRIAALREADPASASVPVPVDLVTASASGLDPHISPAAALYQVHRVAVARGLDEGAVRALVEDHVEGRTFGLLGESRVNVVRLNRALDALVGGPPPGADQPGRSISTSSARPLTP